MPANSFEQLVETIDAINKAISNSSDSLNDTAKFQQQYSEALRNATLDAIDAIKKTSLENETALKNAIDSEIRARQEAEEKLIAAKNKEIEAKEQQTAVDNAIKTEENNNQQEYLRNKKFQLEEEIRTNQEKQRIYQAFINGDKDTYERLILEQELKIQQEKENNRLLEEERKKREETLSKIGKIADEMFRALVNTYTSAIDSVTNIYNQEAGKMSALLNTTVRDISQLQRNIASELRNDNLSKAISNVAVLNEASSLVSSGYTDQTTLQQNAIDIAIGKELAPNVDFNNASVKNLINVFGSDFTHKFTAIQQAAQETAGSTVNIANNLSSLMTNLEPVYLNAQYQTAALQGTSDITATLANAREQGIITQAQEKEYLSMLTELMDPSKAFKSSNLAVKVAATNYDFNGNPADALAALISAQQQYYNNFDQSNSYYGNISRSLGAAVAGNDTMSATYNAQGLTDLTLLSTNDLDATYNEQLSKLQSGAYTTATEATQNAAENSAFTQTVSQFAKDFPRTYKVISTTIISSINSLPSRIVSALAGNSDGGILSSIFGRKGSQTSVTGSGGGIGGTGSDNSSGGFGSFLNNTFISDATKNKGLLGKRFNTLGKVAIGANAVRGGISIADYALSNDEDTLAQSLSYGGDIGRSMMDWGSAGAGIGMFFGPVGAAIGGLIGAVGGLTTALIANNEIERANTEATLALEQSTKDVLGPGIEKLSSLEAKAEIARGGGTIDLNSGTYALDMNVPKAATGIDYVPYDDYLVKLHKGESVVTAQAATQLRKSNPNFWNIPISNNDDVVSELEKQTQSIVDAIKGDTDILPMQQQMPKMYNIKNII